MGSPMNRATWIAISFTVVSVFVLLPLTDLHAFRAAFGRLSPGLVVSGLALWALTNLLRALRFRALVLSREVKLARMLSIVNVQNFLASVTPGRAGELSYVVLLRQDVKVPGAEGLGGLVLARAFDFVIVFGVAVLALLSVRDALPQGSGTVVGMAVAIFVGSLFLLLQLAWLTEGGVRILEGVLRWTRLGRWPLPRRALGKAREVHAYIVRAKGARSTGRIWILTAGIWVTSYGVSCLLLTGVALPLSIDEVIFVAAVAGLAGSLPIQGLAGLGTTEAGWAIPLVLLGIGREEAIAVSFCFHGVTLIYLAILGTAGAIHLSLARKVKTLSQPGK